ncbi:hypothetical protein BJ322DRAFT_114057 [Thelephora terrestris]|uniref:Uncharacterized protein n=1 Tax=Thelephora terrestris TaxID=56493 RepID=A0A9P6LDM9_9AGAM|nr:hypothetical protein BJ322DRAFT_114057 [Thelephora terrestris]
MFRPQVMLLALVLSLSFVTADTSLYIPGYEDEPVSVTVLGVGSDGRTTWRIEPGTPTGTVSPVVFIPTVWSTMVQGPSDAVLYASLPDQVGLTVSCALSSGEANCVGRIDENDTLTITTTFSEPVKSYLVQGGGGSPPTPTPAPSGSGSNSTTNGSSVTNAAMGVGLLVGGVVAGMITLFLV